MDESKAAAERKRKAAYMRKWRRKNLEHARDLERESARRNQKARSKRWLAWYHREKAKHPEKFRARDRVAYAVKTGRLVRLPCEVCGNPKSEAHHDDYAKRLEVRWLCRLHHVGINP